MGSLDIIYQKTHAIYAMQQIINLNLKAIQENTKNINYKVDLWSNKHIKWENRKVNGFMWF